MWRGVIGHNTRFRTNILWSETFGTRGMPVRIRLPQQDMTREQCQHCGRHSYSDGRCYADRKMKGRPISDYCYCDWAKPPYELPGKLLKRSRMKK